MNGSGNLESIGGGYSVDIVHDEDGWYGVLFDAMGLDVWETEPLPDAESVRAAAQAVVDKVGDAR